MMVVGRGDHDRVEVPALVEHATIVRIFRGPVVRILQHLPLGGHWPWYGKMIGGHFAKHPPGTPAGTLKVVDRKHEATKRVAPTMRRVDEWYYFEDYNPEAHLLVTLDPASIGEKDVNPNPVSWAHEFEGGRVFYTAMGHTNETYADPNFLNHLAGGLRWVTAKRKR